MLVLGGLSRSWKRRDCLPSILAACSFSLPLVFFSPLSGMAFPVAFQILWLEPIGLIQLRSRGNIKAELFSKFLVIKANLRINIQKDVKHNATDFLSCGDCLSVPYLA